MMISERVPLSENGRHIGYIQPAVEPRRRRRFYVKLYGPGGEVETFYVGKRAARRLLAAT